MFALGVVEGHLGLGSHSGCLWGGKVCSKEFAVKKYGYDEAFRSAVIAREQAIGALNSRNANYNKEHGK